MPASSYPEELARLIAVLDWAVEIQPEADRIVRVCAAEPNDVPARLARGATRLAYAFVRMAGQLEEPVGIPELDEYRTRALGLIRYHVFMLHGSLDLAFNSTLRDRRTDPRAAAHGLDQPGADLRDLCLEVRAAQHRYAHPG
ncbi:hypothetical protein [Actinoallomurus iriomotensis]|uniref:Uncharacterized protein n=1 Tax=Actinoallomurus iriomotensis TaxID=478107 RepID=A0A9W6RTR4_9ACTN|nr:hypothetical protein [Actinoallomurus iriomotensis]GLY82421.1 hypothetical protein Airi02_003530 [Actinoallomurus iriomotensis]